jgi:TPR repeat protein
LAQRAAPTNQTAPPERQLTDQEILAALTKEAESGNPQAMIALGLAYERFDIFSRDYGKALEWYKKAAAKNSAEGHYFVGLCYMEGKGTRTDLKMAAQSFQKASQIGLPQADYQLALMFTQGLGVDKDLKKGLEFLVKSANANYGPALNELGLVHLVGQLGFKRDEAKAFELFNKSANQGFSDAMENLGFIFREGLGRPVNNVQALKWYLLARLHGGASPALQETINVVRDKLKPEEVAMAEKEVNAWRDNQAKAAQEPAAPRAINVK